MFFPATILTSYQGNRGCIVLPKLVTFSRIEDNLEVISLAKKLKELSYASERLRQEWEIPVCIGVFGVFVLHSHLLCPWVDVAPNCVTYRPSH